MTLTLLTESGRWKPLAELFAQDPTLTWSMRKTVFTLRCVNCGCNCFYTLQKFSEQNDEGDGYVSTHLRSLFRGVEDFSIHEWDLLCANCGTRHFAHLTMFQHFPEEAEAQ